VQSRPRSQNPGLPRSIVRAGVSPPASYGVGAKKGRGRGNSWRKTGSAPPARAKKENNHSRRYPHHHRRGCKVNAGGRVRQWVKRARPIRPAQRHSICSSWLALHKRLGGKLAEGKGGSGAFGGATSWSSASVGQHMVRAVVPC